MQLKKMFDDYLEYIKLFLSEGYVEYQREQAKQILKYFDPETDSSEIKDKSLFGYIKFLKENELSANTINKYISTIKRVFNFCEMPNDFKKVKKLKEPFVTYGLPSENPVAIIKSCESFLSDQSMLILYILLDTGVRLHELLNIEIANIDFKNRNILLTTTKTGVNRYVFFTEKTKKFATSFCQKAKNKKYLFENPKTHEKLKNSAIESLFARIRSKLKIKKFSPHRLRHNLSTSLFNNGANIMLITSILGHSNPIVTQRYIHPNLKSSLKMYDEFSDFESAVFCDEEDKKKKP